MRVRKRLFILLALGGLFVIGAAVFFWWYVSQNPGTRVAELSLNTVALALLVVVIAAYAGILLLIISLTSEKSLGPVNTIIVRLLNLIYPPALMLSKLLKLDEDRVRRSYIEIHNQVTGFKLKEAPAKKTLILAPHCLQKSDCPYKITIDADNCRRCGRCAISGLHDIAASYHAQLAVATGGTLARDFIRQYRPGAVLAIACERDLTAGIQDVVPLPVIGVLNLRPNGPCHNTSVNLSEVRQALEKFFRQH